MNKLKLNLNDKSSKELLEFSNVSILDTTPFQKGKNVFFRVKCNNCGKEFNKVSCSFGVSKCQCWKAINGAYNYKGFEEISSIYFNRVAERAEMRNITFNITKEDVWNQWIKQEGKCALTGLEIKIQRNYKKARNMTASLDRIDSSLGYTIDNIQWVHKDVNRMKNNFTEERFLEICKLVVNLKSNE